MKDKINNIPMLNLVSAFLLGGAFSSLLFGLRLSKDYFFREFLLYNPLSYFGLFSIVYLSFIFLYIAFMIIYLNIINKIHKKDKNAK